MWLRKHKYETRTLYIISVRALLIFPYIFVSWTFLFRWMYFFNPHTQKKTQNKSLFTEWRKKISWKLIQFKELCTIFLCVPVASYFVEIERVFKKKRKLHTLCMYNGIWNKLKCTKKYVCFSFKDRKKITFTIQRKYYYYYYYESELVSSTHVENQNTKLILIQNHEIEFKLFYSVLIIRLINIQIFINKKFESNFSTRRCRI